MIIDDSRANRIKYSPVCLRCKNLTGQGLTETCIAFPNGIPYEIWSGENKHTSPYPGDHGIHFEARK